MLNANVGKYVNLTCTGLNKRSIREIVSRLRKTHDISTIRISSSKKYMMIERNPYKHPTINSKTYVLYALFRDNMNKFVDLSSLPLTDKELQQQLFRLKYTYDCTIIGHKDNEEKTFHHRLNSTIRTYTVERIKRKEFITDRMKRYVNEYMQSM